MEIITTKEILDKLQINGLTICTANYDQPAALTAISLTKLICILPTDFVLPSEVIIKIKIQDTYYQINSFNNTRMSNNIYALNFSSSELPKFFIKSIGDLFSLKDIAQKRKETRISIDESNIAIYKKSLVITRNKNNYDCSISDISFSGAKLLFLSEAAPVYQDLLVLKVDFFAPADSFFLLSEVIRRRDFMIDRYNFSEVALLFKDPINVFYQARLQKYFEELKSII